METEAPVQTPASASGDKRVRITAPRLRAISTRVAAAQDDIDRAKNLVDEMMAGRENRSGEKVDALRAAGSLLNQFDAAFGRVTSDIDDLIQLVLDDD